MSELIMICRRKPQPPYSEQVPLAATLGRLTVLIIGALSNSQRKE